MAEVVDAIISRMVLQMDDYVRNYEHVTKTVRENTAALKENAAAEAANTRGKGRASRVTADERAATDAVKKAAKERADAERQAAKAAADAARAAEKVKQAAARDTWREQAKAAREAEKRAAADRAASDAAVAAVNREIDARKRLEAVVARGVARPSVAAAAESSLGGEAGSRSAAARQTAAMRGSVSLGGASANSAASPAAEQESRVNHLLADQFDLRQRLKVASRGEAAELRAELEYLDRINVYRRAGLSDAEAIRRAEENTAAIEARRVRLAADQNALLERRTRAQAAQVERQTRRQSGSIASTIAVLAPTIVGGVSAAQVSEINDEYIKFANTLKIAGVSTSEFETVQARLLATANRTGTDLNALAGVYRGGALAAKDLGATSADLLQVSDAVANALRIQGRSSVEARGALLQLGQVLQSGTVRAEEFNSLTEGAYPILQAVARGSDEYSGSVAKLRQAVLAGEVSSREFFQALLRGSGDLEARAGRATLTTAQGFTALRNALVVYFGTADQAQGVSAALGAALQALANNLDLLVPAIAAVGTALAVGYVVRLGAAAIATQNLGQAILGAFGGPVGLAITTLTVAIGSFGAEANRTSALVGQANAAYAEMQDRLRTASTQAATAAGGVRGVGSDAQGAIPKVNAFAGAVGNLAQQLYNQARAARAARLESLQQQLKTGQEREVALARRTPAGRRMSLADTRRGDFLGNAAILGRNYVADARSFLSGGRTDREAESAVIQQAAVNRRLQRQIREASTTPLTAQDIPGGAPVGGNPANAARITKLEREIADLRNIAAGASGKRLTSINRQITRRQQQVEALANGASAGAAAAGSYVAGAGPSAQTLANPAEAQREERIRNERQFDSDLRRAQGDYVGELADLATNAAERAKLERERVRAAQEQVDKEIASRGPGKDGTGEYTADQVRQLQQLNGRTADLRIEAIDRQERQRVADEATRIAVADLESQRQQLSAREQLATTTKQRRKLALDLIALEYRQRELELQATLSPDSGASAADREIARRRLAALPSERNVDEAAAQQQTDGPLAAYVRQMPRTADEINQALESVKVRGLQSLDDAITDSIGNVLALGGAFGDVANSIISDLIRIGVQRAIIGPLADTLFGSSTAGQVGGLLGKVFGGRASGGNIVGGVPYNIGERGPETVVFPSSGKVYPNGALPQIGASGGGGGGTIRIEVGAGEYFDARVAGVSGPIASSTAVKVFRAGAPGLVAQTLNATPAKLSQTRTLEG